LAPAPACAHIDDGLKIAAGADVGCSGILTTMASSSSSSSSNFCRLPVRIVAV
jgi:hypothetical protein